MVDMEVGTVEGMEGTMEVAQGMAISGEPGGMATELHSVEWLRL